MLSLVAFVLVVAYMWLPDVLFTIPINPMLIAMCLTITSHIWWPVLRLCTRMLVILGELMIFRARVWYTAHRAQGTHPGKVMRKPVEHFDATVQASM